MGNKSISLFDIVISVTIQIRHICVDNLSYPENTSILSLQIDTSVRGTRVLDNSDHGRSYLH